jgi:hypothetical protein
MLSVPRKRNGLSFKGWLPQTRPSTCLEEFGQHPHPRLRLERCHGDQEVGQWGGARNRLIGHHKRRRICVPRSAHRGNNLAQE